MRPHELERKNVLSKDARQLGTVTGVELDIPTWKATHLVMGLSDKMLQPFGLTLEKTPGIKQVEILVPVETIETVADYIILNKTVEELKPIIKKAP